MSSHREHFARLSQKARALPKVPGVYLMKDENGVVLYVGKAGVLPNRVSTYFQPATDLGPNKQRMLDLIRDFDVIECEGEWEALLTENRLIKDLHPKFNARLTDDKSFPYLAITMRDDFPGVFITRDPGHPRFKGAKLLGPFTSPYALRESVKLLQRVFKFRTCELDIREDDEKRRFFRPCLLHPIKQCTAPCADRISREDYRRDIDKFVKFIESKRSVMLRQMRREMAEASAAKDYEQAAVLRDQIHAIEKLDERGRKSDRWQPEIESFYVDPKKGLASLQRALDSDADLRCVECIDIAHLQGEQTVGAKVCFVDGRPLKNEYRRYRIHTAGNDDYMAIREVVSRAYREAGRQHQLYPDLVIIDGGAGQLSSAMEAFARFDQSPPLVVALAKAEELIYVPGQAEPLRLSRQNPGLKL
ncbi:MAG: UvrB/UvrC motif-containing protein, partial [Phycisphaerae bacterium]|nr:UvrB/UvrC motif-containing protein [Phycisphaerae bacterium]